MDEMLNTGEAGDAQTAYGVTPCSDRVQVLMNGYLIGDSAAAMLSRQPGQPDIYYLPKDDVEMTFFVQTDETDESERFTAQVPLPNGASYWRVMRNGTFIQRAAWSFETQGAGPGELHGMIGFDPKAFEFHTVHDDRLWKKQADEMGEYIRHTDSGSGVSQERPWEATVKRPEDAEGDVFREEPERPPSLT